MASHVFAKTGCVLIDAFKSFRGYMEALQEETIRREDRTNVLMLHKEALVAVRASMAFYS